MLRKDLLETLHHIKRNVDRMTLRTYSEKRKHYKKIIKEKKSHYWEAEGRRIAEEAKKDPYIALRPRKQAQTQYISMEQWETHFQDILNNKRITNKPDHNPEENQQETEEWTPLTIEEVQNAIYNTKNKKAAGPDRLYNEYIKDTAQIMTPVWTKLYNKCLGTASTREQ